MNAFFIGIGGMGMSALAKILHIYGFKVGGSDRNLNSDYCFKLKKLGIPIYPQDGKGIANFLESQKMSPDQITVVKSTAVEDRVLDVIAARNLGIREIMRSDLLAQMFNSTKGIAVGGSSGKTTTSGLIAWVLKFAGLEPTCAIGGNIGGLDTNAFVGKGPYFVIEADESDGSIVKYHSYIAVLTNISRDHKSIEELKELFRIFCTNIDNSGWIVLCLDDDNLKTLFSQLKGKILTYGLSKNADISPSNVVFQKDHTYFTFKGTPFCINMPGQHNLQNALAALAVAEILKIPTEETAAAITAFPGMKRRFERVGTVNGITVVDDFAHNPAEISAAINAARQASKRRFIIYQPHGFGPTKFTREDLIKVFQSLTPEESLFLDEIYYGGGTVEKDISSREIVEEIKLKFPNAYFPGNREKIVNEIVRQAQPGDMVLVMGARDINTICPHILDSLKKEVHTST